jgi:kanosamine-6-phosphate phosphatase
VEAKLRAHKLRFVPHILASSVGAELCLASRELGFRELPAWEQAIADSGFSVARVDEARAALEARGVTLRRQKQRGARIESYYHDARGDERDERAVAAIRELAEAHGLGVNVSPCNPGAGDPEGAYDVDFFPAPCGKANTVRFLLRHYGIARENALAFGDSGGDLGMLEAVGHGYLVANATPTARARFQRVAAGEYAEGILVELRRYLDAARAPAGA